MEHLFDLLIYVLVFITAYVIGLTHRPKPKKKLHTDEEINEAYKKTLEELERPVKDSIKMPEPLSLFTKEELDKLFKEDESSKNKDL